MFLDKDDDEGYKYVYYIMSDNLCKLKLKEVKIISFIFFN